MGAGDDLTDFFASLLDTGTMVDLPFLRECLAFVDWDDFLTAMDLEEVDFFVLPMLLFTGGR